VKTCLHLSLGGAIIAALLWRLGLQPFLTGFGALTWRSVILAGIITAATTVCCAWRWSVIGQAMGLHLRFGAAVSAYYRSQFINVALPGGVVGDVDRAVRGPTDAGSLSQRTRSVLWDRATGQAINVALTAALFALLPSPMTKSVATLTGAAVAAAGLIGFLIFAGSRASRWIARVAESVRCDLRRVAGDPGRVGRIAAASVITTVGHVAVFLLAFRSVLPQVSLSVALPVALVVLVASAIPANVAGWGPREGAAAWAFSSCGLGASAGVAVAVSYGLLVVVATLPGAAAVLRAPREPSGALGGTRSQPSPEEGTQWTTSRSRPTPSSAVPSP
jgi:glycosyltransferase 2 family protein